MNNDMLWKNYLDYLLKRIHFDKKRYYKVLLMLHNIAFVYDENIPMDKNRASDGVYLRYYFFKDMGLIDADFDRPCSVVEMLVALTERIASEYIDTYGYDGERREDIIFYMFLNNLGIREDDFYEEVEEKVNFWMYREYKNDGKGSIFPLKRLKKDYNMTEIWTQISIFLKEWSIKNLDDLEIFM